MELVQNRYPFPEDLTSIELLVYITHGEVRTYAQPHSLLANIPPSQPPQLTDEADVKWPNDMKEFIKQTYGHY